METVTPFFQPDTALNLAGDVDSVNGNTMEGAKKATMAPKPKPKPTPTPTPVSEAAASPTFDAIENHPGQTANHTETPEITDTADPEERPEDDHDNSRSSMDEDVESTPAEKGDTEQDTVSS